MIKLDLASAPNLTFALTKLCIWKINKTQLGTKPPLLAGLRDNRRRKATDLRDKAYSLLLTCAVPRDHPDLRIDYSFNTDPWSVFQRFTKWILCNDKDPIKVLYDCGESSLKRPTWCPDWRSEPEAPEKRRIRDGTALYKAGGTSRCELRSDPSLNACKCDGLVVDEVGYLGPMCDGNLADFYAWEQQARKWLFKLQGPILEPSAPGGDNSASTALASRYIDANLIEQAHIRTLTGDDLPGTKNTSTCFRKAYDARKMYQMVLEEYQGYPFSEAINNTVDIPVGTRVSPASYYYRIVNTAGGRRLCIMRSGSLALCPARSKTSDAVVILLGSALPFVMRSNLSFYHLLGGAYVDGIMYGEALSYSALQIHDVIIV